MPFENDQPGERPGFEASAPQAQPEDVKIAPSYYRGRLNNALRDPQARTRMRAVLGGLLVSAPRVLALPLICLWALFVGGYVLMWPWVASGISEAAFTTAALVFTALTLFPLGVALYRSWRLLEEGSVRHGLCRYERWPLIFVVLLSLTFSYIPLLFSAAPVAALILNLLGLEVR